MSRVGCALASSARSPCAARTVTAAALLRTSRQLVHPSPRAPAPPPRFHREAAGDAAAAVRADSMAASSAGSSNARSGWVGESSRLRACVLGPEPLRASERGGDRKSVV